ncbi:MAG TPA: acylphosphatase [Thermoflexia bacterium]|nr:acylphosphatase [Thermoflexia bacterium]
MTEKQEQVAVQIIVHGAVQGVGFRYFTCRNASRLGVVGWVRNAYNGTVEIQAEGTQVKLQQLINQVRQGPGHAHVTKLALAWQNSTGQFHTFGIRY